MPRTRSMFAAVIGEVSHPRLDQGLRRMSSSRPDVHSPDSTSSRQRQRRSSATRALPARPERSSAQLSPGRSLRCRHDPLAVYRKEHDQRSSGWQMSGKKRFGDPRKSQAAESSRQARGRSRRELSAGFLLVAWAVFFVLWLAVGSLLVAAIVFGVLLSGGIAVLNAS